MKPSEAETITDVMSLQTSHCSSSRWDLMIQHDGAAVLVEHERGQDQAGSVVIPRRHFQKMLAWYETEQKDK